MASTIVWRRLRRDMGWGGDITICLSRLISPSNQPGITLRNVSDLISFCYRKPSILSDPHHARIPFHSVLHASPPSSVPPRSAGLSQDCTQSAITGLVTSLADRKSKGRRFPQPYIYVHTLLPARSCTSVTHQTHCQTKSSVCNVPLDTYTLPFNAATSLSPIDVG
jgi:hypothetical protein